MMKKLIAIAVSIILILSLTACGDNSQDKLHHAVGKNSPEELVNDVISCFQKGGNYSDIESDFDWSGSVARYMCYHDFSQGIDKALSAAHDLEQGSEYLMNNHKSFIDWWRGRYDVSDGVKLTEKDVAKNWICYPDGDGIMYWQGLTVKNYFMYTLILYDKAQDFDSAGEMVKDVNTYSEYAWSNDDILKLTVDLIEMTFTGETDSMTKSKLFNMESVSELKSFLAEIWEHRLAEYDFDYLKRNYSDRIGSAKFDQANLEKCWIDSVAKEEHPNLRGFYTYRILVDENGNSKTYVYIDIFEQNGKFLISDLGSVM